VTKRPLAIAALLLVATAWGMSFTLVKNVLTRIAPEPFIMWRFLLAGVALLLLAAWRRELRRAILFPGLALGALVFAGYWSQTRALIHISPSRSAFLTGLYVVMVPFADRLLHGVRVSRRAWIGSVLATVGTMMLIGGGIDIRPQPGDLLTVFCAVCFALHVVLSAKYSVAAPATALAAVQVFVVGVAAIIPAMFAPRPQPSVPIVAVIVFTALVTTALAFVFMMWGQARVSATEAVVLLAFEPVAASITSIVWDHEAITLPFLGGAALILTAMVLSQLPERPSRPQPQ
jgi:drug/metabolite transporter (DMT)-like permease